MNTPRDPMWERVVDDHRPRRSELAAAETELAAANAHGLAPDAIAAMVARAVATPTRADAGLPTRPRTGRLLVVSLATVLFLTPLAWVGAQVVWPEQRASSLTLTYSSAVHRALHAAKAAERASAVSVVDDHCLATLRVLRAVAQGDDDALAAAAAEARAELRRQWSAAPVPSIAAAVDVYGLVRTAGDASLATAVRSDALAGLLRATAPGLAAMRLARLDGQDDLNRRDLLARLERTLK